MSDDVLREDREGLAIVTLNRPKKLNAISLAMRDVIFRAVDALRDRADLRALLIRARGRYFTAGVDIAEGGGPRAAQVRAIRRWWGPAHDLPTALRLRDRDVHLSAGG